MHSLEGGACILWLVSCLRWMLYESSMSIVKKASFTMLRDTGIMAL